MSKRDDGGPAFPGGWENDSDLNLTAPDGRVIPPMTMHYMSGMSLRDYFAAKAMSRMQQEFKQERYPVLAAKAYVLADAMLAERAK